MPNISRLLGRILASLAAVMLVACTDDSVFSGSAQPPTAKSPLEASAKAETPREAGSGDDRALPPAKPESKPVEPLPPSAQATDVDPRVVSSCLESLGAAAGDLGDDPRVRRVTATRAGVIAVRDETQTETPELIVVEVDVTGANTSADLFLQNDRGFYCLHVTSGKKRFFAQLILNCGTKVVSSELDGGELLRELVTIRRKVAGGGDSTCAGRPGAEVATSRPEEGPVREHVAP